MNYTDIDRKFPTIYNLYDSYRYQLSQKYDKFAVFIKIGYFYHLFSYTIVSKSKEFENLEEISSILNLTIITKNKHYGINNRNPMMIGFLVQSLNEYVPKLTSNGYSVFIIEEFDLDVGITSSNQFIVDSTEKNNHMPNAILPEPTYVKMKLVMRHLKELTIK
jgi:DNA mismatch repair ATPase MutS